MKTTWTKLKHEEEGTLKLYTGDIVKHFVDKHRSEAVRRAGVWYRNFRKGENEVSLSSKETDNGKGK